MWELVKDFLLVSMGMGIGVVLMCMLSVGKEADYKKNETIKRKRGQLNEFRSKFVSMVFIKCTELGAYVDRGYRYLLRFQA